MSNTYQRMSHGIGNAGGCGFWDDQLWLCLGVHEAHLVSFNLAGVIVVEYLTFKEKVDKAFLNIWVSNIPII